MSMATGFEILPAIDLRGGGVVRLRQGDFDRQTAYEGDPVDVAEGFARAGARWLHVVDLDGARTGVPAHGSIIVEIVAAVGDRAAVEVKDRKTVELQSAALANPVAADPRRWHAG